MLMSDATACNYDSIYHQKGIITAFKEAGFRTAVFSPTNVTTIRLSTSSEWKPIRTIL